MIHPNTGLWIRIHFLRIRIQIFFSMRIRILSQPNKICKKLPYKVLKKTRKIPHKLKIMELIHIYLNLLNKSTDTIITNFLAFV